MQMQKHKSSFAVSNHGYVKELNQTKQYLGSGHSTTEFDQESFYDSEDGSEEESIDESVSDLVSGAPVKKKPGFEVTASGFMNKTGMRQTGMNKTDAFGSEHPAFNEKTVDYTETLKLLEWERPI